MVVDGFNPLQLVAKQRVAAEAAGAVSSETPTVIVTSVNRVSSARRALDVDIGVLPLRTPVGVAV
jgi:hypothetical protein